MGVDTTASPRSGAAQGQGSIHVLPNSCEARTLTPSKTQFIYGVLSFFKILFFKLIYFYFLMAALSLCRCMQAFSSWGAYGSHCGSFPCGSQALGCPGSVVGAHGLSCPAACGIFPGPGIEPEYPALADGFLITEPPGKFSLSILDLTFFHLASLFEEGSRLGKRGLVQGHTVCDRIRTPGCCSLPHHTRFV